MNLRKRFNLFKWDVKLLLAGWYFTLFKKTYKVEGLDLIVPFSMTDVRFRGYFIIDFYEKQERIYLKRYLPKDATVLELGACLGIVSCITNRLLIHPERHLVVEANPALIPVIQTNQSRNQCQFRIEHCMISDRKINAFYIGKNILMSSNRRQTARKVSVKGCTISELEQKHGLNFNTLIMDIEGGELAILRENKAKLSEFHVIFMEIHPHPEILSSAEILECAQILAEAGFEKVVDDQNFWVMQRKNA